MHREIFARLVVHGGYQQKRVSGEIQTEHEHALARSCCISYCASTGRKPLPPFWPRPSRPSCWWRSCPCLCPSFCSSSWISTFCRRRSSRRAPGWWPRRRWRRWPMTALRDKQEGWGRWGGWGSVGAGCCVIDQKLQGGRKQLLEGASQSIFPSNVGKSDYTTWQVR